MSNVMQAMTDARHAYRKSVKAKLTDLAEKWAVAAATLAVETGEFGYDSTDDMVNDEMSQVYAECATALRDLRDAL